MKEPLLSKAMGQIDDDIILEAMEIEKPSKQFPRKRFTGMAAVIALIFVAAGGVTLLSDYIWEDAFKHGAGTWYEKTVYLDANIPRSERVTGYMIYTPILDVDDSMDNLYRYLQEKSMLRRNCFPIFRSKDTISFSGTSDPGDTQQMRYQEWTEYIGKENFCYNILEMTKGYHTSEGVECLLIQHETEETIEAIGLRLPLDRMKSATMYLLISRDFSMISDQGVRTEIEEWKGMEDSYLSEVMGQKVCITYMCRQRQGDGEDTKEAYTYYAYWEKEGLEYILQLDTGYIKGSSPQEQQEHRREVFEKMLEEILKL